MKKYFTILLRNQFNLFYRFGFIKINKKDLIEFNDIFDDELNNKILEYFKNLLPYEYPEDYIILILEKETIDEVNTFYVENLIKLMALNDEAKQLIESRLDTRIKINGSLSDKLFAKIENEIKNNNIDITLKALWHILEFDDDYLPYLNKIDKNNLLEAYNYTVKGNNFESNEKGGESKTKIYLNKYLSLIYSYQRKKAFPKNSLGFFYDALQIYGNYIESLDIEQSKYFKLLEEIRIAGLKDLYEIKNEIIKQNDKSKKFQEFTRLDGLELSDITTLFLYLKNNLNECIEKNDISNSILVKEKQNLLDNFKESFKYTVVLLSAYYWFSDFYDYYYDKLNLRIFKQKEVSEIVTDKVEKVSKRDESTVAIIQNDGKEDKKPEDNKAKKEVAHEIKEMLTEQKEDTKSTEEKISGMESTNKPTEQIVEEQKELADTKTKKPRQSRSKNQKQNVLSDAEIAGTKTENKNSDKGTKKNKTKIKDHNAPLKSENQTNVQNQDDEGVPEIDFGESTSN